MNKAMLLILIISAVLSVYMVVGGIADILINEKFEAALELPEDKVELGNSTFHNVEYQEANGEYEKMKRIFPVYDWLGTTISYLLTLMAFGLLGSIIRILILKLSKIPNYGANLYTALILGSFIGLLTIVISEVLPEFKSKSGNNKVFYTMALVGGVFTLEVFEWLKKKFFGFMDKNKDSSAESN